MMMVAQDHGTAHVLLTKPLKKNTLQYMIGAASLPVTAHPEFLRKERSTSLTKQ
jgi:hypothetical protein